MRGTTNSSAQRGKSVPELLLFFIKDGRQGTLEEQSNILVVGFLRQQPVPIKNASRVCIHHKDRMISCIEKNRIRGLRTNSIQAQQLSAQFICRLSEHSGERPAVLFVQKSDEGLQPLGFLPKIARGSNQTLQIGQMRTPDPLYA